MEEATDQPPTIQVMLVTSPSSVPIWTTIAVARMKPQDSGQMYERPRDCSHQVSPWNIGDVEIV